ncbi:hypothetical protein RJ639_005342 [Escallonia herrerae]|uniref:Rab3-GAP regulatory subunit N-terminal domain-containing protein n=1 Tax=Escallonia herrerae TaxID=1293975 RepID=A0AA88VXF1_9ASTE|nr:hypothetical protein RJ639_005342 [Escallonia herrerae]
MARRNHTVELGYIVCDDLSELGAGKEGWLVENPNLLCALDTHSIALANRSTVLVLEWSNSSDADGYRTRIRPTLSPIEAEYISAVEWLVFDDIRVLALGTSCGYLLIYSLGGDLVHKQLVYPGRILKLRVRGTNRDLKEDASSEEVSVVMPGVIARFDGSDIQSMLRRWQETQTQFWDLKLESRHIENSGNFIGRLPYQLWNVSKYGSCADAAITGIMPPPLMEVQDHPRKGEKLTLSPSGTLAAITDSLGRILLLDTQALVVVRLWKGYRDANCLFVEMLVNKEATVSSSSYVEHVKSDYCLCLAIHAPRKGIVEVWQMRTGPRLFTIPCTKGSKMLQPTYRFESSAASPSSYVPLEVFLLNGDSGQLSVLSRSLK